MESRPKPISIWQPTTVEGGLAWVRPEPSPLGDHHAESRVLRPRPPQGAPERARHRICVFGESVAAGYLYAPHLTAASALERCLARVTGRDTDQGHEVIDLARTNETLAGLVSTVEASLQLEPDLLVLFAGNNWNLLETPEVSPHVPSPGDRRRFAEALEQAGLAGPVGFARKTLDGRAREALARIAGLAAGAGADVVAVIPEVNLADWQDLQPPPWLPGGLPGEGVAGWYEALDEARAALAGSTRRDLEAAEAAAWRMNRLDGSTTPVPFRLLGEIWRARGEIDHARDARDAFLAEVDSVHYPLLAFLAAPRATTAARTILAEAAAGHGWGRVDLREVFERHTGSPLPGRRLFLDYCHLTSEGMTVAMAATAAEVLGRLASPTEEAPWDWNGFLLALNPASPEARAELLGLTPEAEATAYLGAALHGAHRHLPVSDRRPILEHWCAAALDASPGVASALADLAEIRRAPPETPEVLTEACRRNLASPYPIRLQHGLRWGGLDGEVLLAARAALERALERTEQSDERSTEIGQAIAAIDRTLTGAGDGRGDAIPPEGLELARGPNGGWRHLAEPLARFYPEAMELRDLTGRAALRCPWPETGFWLPVGEDLNELRLHLTARLPPIPGVDLPRRGTVAVSIDGREAGRCLLGGRWTRATFRIPAGALAGLKPGLHRVTVRWPMPPPVGEAALEEAKRRLARGVEADLHPVFGEVYSLLVQP